MDQVEKNGIIKIAVIGAESTGKTSLCEQLAAHYKTVWVPEYAREYFNDSDIYNYTLDDLACIAEKQMALENEYMKKADRFLFCDTTLITLKIWAELEFEKVPAIISENIEKIKYAHYLVTDNSLPWIEDELRQNKFSRDLLLEMNVNEVKKLGSSYSLVTGGKKERLSHAIKVLSQVLPV